jgi:hypothetical protein
LPTGGSGNLLDGFVVKLSTDNDSLDNSVDLDSDNDGIPDNVEAQATATYDVPSATWADADGDGLADQYDPDFVGSTPVDLPDTDGAGTADFLDSDSDNDGYTDCEEGLDPNLYNRSCPIDKNDPNLGINGLIDWAGADGYWDTDHSIANGDVEVPNPDSFGADLEDEVTGNNEAAYREFLCGKNRITLTHLQWRIISFSCDTGAGNGIEALIGGTNGLGTYGNDWVMYKQSGSDGFEVNAAHKNTNKLMMTSDEHVVPGKGYWIIVDTSGNPNAVGNEINVTINKTLSGISPVLTVDTSDVDVVITDPSFTKVHVYNLPNNEMNQGGDVKKYMVGNPFPFAFQLSDLYFKHTGESYKRMGDSFNDTYINSIVYKHDSPETGPITGYTAIDPATPGFNGSVQPMEGFFIKIEPIVGDNLVNHFAFPLMNKKP